MYHPSRDIWYSLQNKGRTTRKVFLASLWESSPYREFRTAKRNPNPNFPKFISLILGKFVNKQCPQIIKKRENCMTWTLVSDCVINKFSSHHDHVFLFEFQKKRSLGFCQSTAAVFIHRDYSNIISARRLLSIIWQANNKRPWNLLPFSFSFRSFWAHSWCHCRRRPLPLRDVIFRYFHRRHHRFPRKQQPSFSFSVNQRMMEAPVTMFVR